MAVGLKEFVPITSLELCYMAIFDGSCTPEYIQSLVALQTSSPNVAEKINRTIRRMTVNSKLLPYILENKEEFILGNKHRCTRSAMYTSIMCAAYPVFYDILNILGKFFHAQDEVPATLLFEKLREKYGASVNCQRGYTCACRMLIDAGIIERSQFGTYKACRLNKISDFASEMLIQSFLINNPNYSVEEIKSSNIYFEFIK